MSTGPTILAPAMRAAVGALPHRRPADASGLARCRRGVTLLELLVAIALVGLLLALVVPITLANRRTLELDQVRTAANQSLRAAHDLIAADVRIAGERFGEIGLGVLSPVTLSVSDTGSELTLRRALLDWLPVCDSAVNGASIKVANPPGITTATASPGNSGNAPGNSGNAGNSGNNGNSGFGGGTNNPHNLPPECIATRTVSEGNHEWPPNLYAWREHLQANQDQPAVAYIHDPSTGFGQYFNVRVPNNSTMQVQCVAAGGLGCSWNAAADYSVDTSSLIGMVSAISYRVEDGILLRVDQATGDVLRIADGISRFDVTITLQDGSQRTTFDPNESWVRIQSVDVTIVTELDQGATSVEREMAVSYMPRNVLSR